MKSKGKYIPVLICTLALLFLIYHLDITQRFLFIYREQQSMFLYDFDTICERYLSLGGFSLFISHFIVQFFSIKFVGPIVTALIGVVLSYLIWLVVKRIHQALYLLPLCFLPLFYQVNILFDFNYNYEGFISFFLTTVFLYLYVRFAHSMKVPYRIAFASILSLGLYLIAGSIGLLLSCAILVYDVVQKEEKSYLQFITVALVLLLGFYLIIVGELQSSRYAYLNDFYYEPTMEPHLTIQYSWVALIVLLLVALILRFIPKMKASIEIVITIVCLIGVGSYFIHDANKSRRNIIYPIIELQDYIVNEQWDKILNSRYLNINNYLITNYANLALSHKGMLLTHLFDLPQDGANSIMLQGNFAETTPEIWAISAHILYQMGNIASARNIAFDSFVADRYGNPSAPAVPLVMCDAYGADNEDKELNFLMCGFGVGLVFKSDIDGDVGVAHGEGIGSISSWGQSLSVDDNIVNFLSGVVDRDLKGDGFSFSITTFDQTGDGVVSTLRIGNGVLFSSNTADRCGILDVGTRSIFATAGGEHA